MSAKVHASKLALRIGTTLIRSKLEQRRSPLLISGYAVSRQDAHKADRKGKFLDSHTIPFEFRAHFLRAGPECTEVVSFLS